MSRSNNNNNKATPSSSSSSESRTESVTISIPAQSKTVSKQHHDGRTSVRQAYLLPFSPKNPSSTPCGWKLLWWKSKYEELSHSLFLAPSLAVLAGIVAAVGLTILDQALTRNESIRLPVILTTTVESARTVLGTVAGATISFAGTAFSVSLLVIQLGSSQLSPRVVQTLFKDNFNKNVMALVVGTFTYCLVVLRSVRHALDPGDIAVVPSLSVALAVVLGIFSILATVAFIDHSAHSMDVTKLLERVTRETIAQIRVLWVPVAGAGESRRAVSMVQVEIGKDGVYSTAEVLPEWMGIDNDSSSSSTSEEQRKSFANEYVVRFRSSGWVQEIDIPSMLHLVPPNGCIQLHTIEGRYAIPGVAAGTVSWNDDEADPSWLEEVEDAVVNSIQIGMSRTMRMDPAYGLRELVDVTLKALSPGVNDPTTAQDGIFHAAAVVIEFLKRNPPPHQYLTPNGGMLLLGEQQDHDGIVRLAYDEARKCAASSPTVCVYLMESLRLIRQSLRAEGLGDRAPEIERQVRLIEEGCLLSSQVPDDHTFITQARRDRFGDEELQTRDNRRIPRKDDMNTDAHMEPVVATESLREEQLQENTA